MEKEIVGHIEIWVTKTGKTPMDVQGLTDFGTINVLSSLVSYVNKDMSGKPLELTLEDKNRLVAMIYQTLGAEDGFKIINALAWCINRISAGMARDHRIEIPEMILPEMVQ